jgi:hypothetical protein
VIDEEAGTLTLDYSRDHAEVDALDCGWQLQARWTGELGGDAFLAPPVVF